MSIMLNKSPFGSASHFANMGSWKAGSNISNPRRLKAQSRQFFIASWFLLHGNMGRTSKNATTNRFGDHKPKISLKLHCDRHELLGSSEHCKLWVQKIHGEKSFESITDSQFKHRPWRCSSWILTPNSPCNGTQQWHHVQSLKVGRHLPLPPAWHTAMAPCNDTQQWNPGAASTPPKLVVTLPPNLSTLQRHPTMARPLHPAMAPWCHVQSAKVVRRPPPYWK